MRRFGSERIKAVLDRFKLSEEESVIRSNMFTRQVRVLKNGLKETTTIPVNKSFNTMT